MWTALEWLLLIIYVCGTAYRIYELEKRIKKLEEDLEWLNSE